MRRPAACALIGAIALCLGMARTPPGKEANDMKDVSRLMVTEASPSGWNGHDCGVTEPAARVVEDAREWSSLWKEAFSAEAPPVDFEKHFAVAVFLGLRNTGGYSAEFLAPVADEGAVRIPYRERAPAASSFVIQAFTQPYAIQLYRKTSLRVKVERL
ncbi:MAG: protease complex subunit PrcB family protein [Elusimicrobiota bacterium]